MKLHVNPNRMELMRLRRRLGLAERGHKLLKDKLEELMRQFLDNIRRLAELQGSVDEKLRRAFLSFGLTRSSASPADLERMIPEGKLVLKAGREGFSTSPSRSSASRSGRPPIMTFSGPTPNSTSGFKKMRQALPTCWRCPGSGRPASCCPRRSSSPAAGVNALEHILIPNLRETIAAISSRLEEMERSYQVQLMRVKEIIRTH